MLELIGRDECKCVFISASIATRLLSDCKKLTFLRRASPRALLSGRQSQVIRERSALRQIQSRSETTEGAELVDEMWLVVVTASHRRVGPIDHGLLADPLDRALE